MTFTRHATGLLAIAAAASLIGCASSSKPEGTGQYFDDSAITANVKTALFDQPALRSTVINVETLRGVVQLTGVVSSQESINTAVVTAGSVRGVMSVRNDMRLK